MRTRTRPAAAKALAPPVHAAATHVVAAPPPAASLADAPAHDPDDWVPVPRRARVDGLSPEVQRAFIGYLADTGSVRTAAETAGNSPSAFYRLRRSPDGAAFAAAWDAAIQQAAHALVDAAFERAIHGSEEPVWDREGRVIGRRFRQSDAMMMFLLRKHFPDRYGDLHRDRAAPALSATAPQPPPVADMLRRLGSDSPDASDADFLDDEGEGIADPDPDPAASVLGDAFEAALAAAKQEAAQYFPRRRAPVSEENDAGERRRRRR
ncbi:hypothetical protein [Sphingomonas baiyangensis]|uniref:Terminase small subunit n=1 Tax=Sphingomonas baiyangensis TaxID=2572576 RepID=A0A4U1L8J4_9SPHN|nr:hypothetical protein [Sphingomonas baiyangensis]TKD53134.1 hypothetical protein FBR43_02005 [Sphingomonas baiyangensis]